MDVGLVPRVRLHILAQQERQVLVHDNVLEFELERSRPKKYNTLLKQSNLKRGNDSASSPLKHVFVVPIWMLLLDFGGL